MPQFTKHLLTVLINPCDKQIQLCHWCWTKLHSTLHSCFNVLFSQLQSRKMSHQLATCYEELVTFQQNIKGKMLFQFYVLQSETNCIKELYISGNMENVYTYPMHISKQNYIKSQMVLRQPHKPVPLVFCERSL